MDGYIAEICMFAGNFAPRNWSFCDGSVISISQNTALFSLIGTTYGGNGQTNFKLPDTRGRVVIGAGQGPGLSNYDLGQASGGISVALTPAQMPAHSHGIVTTSMVHCNESENDNVSPASEFWGTSNGTAAYGTKTDTPMAGDAVSVNITLANAGAGQAFTNQQPYLGINYVICLYGIFPSRN